MLDDATGLWHMYSAEMVNGCGIDHWVPNSQVVHAVATSFAGPYEKKGVVVLPFAHEPNAVRGPNGEWAIFFTMRHPIGRLYNCTAAAAATGGGDGGDALPPLPSLSPPPPTPPPSPPPPSMNTYMVHSKHPDGPWTEPLMVFEANYSTWDGRKVRAVEIPP